MPFPVCMEVADVFANIFGHIMKSGAWCPPHISTCTQLSGSGQLARAGSSFCPCCVSLIVLVSTVSQLTSSWAPGYAAAGLEIHAACEQSTDSLWAFYRLHAHVNNSSNNAVLIHFTIFVNTRSSDAFSCSRVPLVPVWQDTCI